MKNINPEFVKLQNQVETFLAKFGYTNFTKEPYEGLDDGDSIAYTIPVENCLEGFTIFIESHGGSYTLGINPWLYPDAIKEVRILTIVTLSQFPNISIFFDDDGSVDFNPNSAYTRERCHKITDIDALWEMFDGVDPELDDEIWTDPAGGTHYGDEDDPAAMYE